jgi:hypothetical protein
MLSLQECLKVDFLKIPNAVRKLGTGISGRNIKHDNLFLKNYLPSS